MLQFGLWQLYKGVIYRSEDGIGACLFQGVCETGGFQGLQEQAEVAGVVCRFDQIILVVHRASFLSLKIKKDYRKTERKEPAQLLSACRGYYGFSRDRKEKNSILLFKNVTRDFHAITKTFFVEYVTDVVFNSPNADLEFGSYFFIT